jgi:hypothetical protein
MPRKGRSGVSVEVSENVRREKLVFGRQFITLSCKKVRMFMVKYSVTASDLP